MNNLFVVSSSRGNMVSSHPPNLPTPGRCASILGAPHVRQTLQVHRQTTWAVAPPGSMGMRNGRTLRKAIHPIWFPMGMPRLIPNTIPDLISYGIPFRFIPSTRSRSFSTEHQQVERFKGFGWLLKGLPLSIAGLGCLKVGGLGGRVLRR